LARRATAIAQLREQAQGGVLLLDSGDTLFRGGDTATNPDPDQGALIVEAMNWMSYDALAMGGRDIDAPLTTVRARFEQARFSILSANVKMSDEWPNVLPYLLRQVDGHTVAIIGVAAQGVERLAQPVGLALTVGDPADAIRRTLEQIQSQTDVIILLSNLEQGQNKTLAQTIPGIDAIIGAYRSIDRTPAAVTGPAGQVVLHAPGVQGEYLGTLSVGFDARGQVLSFEGSAIPLTKQYADDPDIMQMMQRYAAQP